MRIRFTIFLLIANVAALLAIFKLEFSQAAPAQSQRALVEITRLQVDGKNVDKPRILVFENNKWRIISPIQWQANYFAVNRILRNLEFLDSENGFSVSEIASHGQSLDDYGLKEPVCVFKYGDGKTMYSLKIGKNASVGDKVYMLDSMQNRVVVADRELADALMVDIERLRSQSVIDIPKFEIASITLRLPLEDAKTRAKTSWKRIGLTRNAEGKWRFETPISAAASSHAVDAFINAVSSALIKSFENVSEVEAGLDAMSWPISMTLDGTNRSQTIYFGKADSAKGKIYAKIAGNPTIFTLDLAPFENLAALQNSLREKNIFRFPEHSCQQIEIASGSDMVNLKKVGDAWDVSGKRGETVTPPASADAATVSRILSALRNTIAYSYVSDLPDENLAQFGLDNPSLKISLAFADNARKTISIGKPYKEGAATLYYAKVDSNSSIYGISGELIRNFKPDFLDYKSKLSFSMPEKSKIVSISILDLKNEKPLFYAAAQNGEILGGAQNLSLQKKNALKTLADFAKKFYIKAYAKGVADAASYTINSKKSDWLYKLCVEISTPGTGTDEISTLQIPFGERISANEQFALVNGELVLLDPKLSAALYELGANSSQMQAQNAK